MPKSKTHAKRARKLEQRNTQENAKAARHAYSALLDALRETLNARFYEEAGFPHLEILAADMHPEAVESIDLSDYLNLQDLFCGLAVSAARAMRRDAPYSMEEREDRLAGVAYALAATFLNLRPDFNDPSGWCGKGLYDALRERWLMPKLGKNGLPLELGEMSDREMVCLFAADFVMSLLDMTGEIEMLGADKLISVTNCKDAVITLFTGFATADATFAITGSVSFEPIFNDNRLTPEFHLDHPNWRPEAADDLNPRLIGFNAVETQDAAFMKRLFLNEDFMKDMRDLYIGPGAAAIPQGKREEVVMGYVLREGPRCQAAFAMGRDPTEEEMDNDAEVVNAILMQLTTFAREGQKTDAA